MKNGFQEIRESTIVEENETFQMSSQAQDLVQAFAKKQDKKGHASKRKSSAFEQNVKANRVLSQKRRDEDALSSSNQDIGVVGNGLRKTGQSNGQKGAFGLAKKSPVPAVKNQRRAVQSNTNSAVKSKQQIPKKQSGVDQSAEGEDFKNKTLRFTNINNFGTSNKNGQQLNTLGSAECTQEAT